MTSTQEQKELEFLGDSLKRLRDFPNDAKQAAGYQLDRIQNGKMPSDFKPMKTVGAGVYEIRIHEDNGEFRVFYVATIGDVVYVLHCFQKKDAETPKKDIDLGRTRYKEIA